VESFLPWWFFSAGSGLLRNKETSKGERERGFKSEDRVFRTEREETIKNF
jgi:hypothetical protein